jgi:hypothetical protein
MCGRCTRTTYRSSMLSTSRFRLDDTPRSTASASHSRRPRPQRDDQVQVHRPLPCGHGDISVTRTGARVVSDSRITVVVAKAPPPPPTTAPPPPTSPPRNCDPSYPDVCLNPNAEDYDRAGGSGNGPLYVEGPISVSPPDPSGLDADGRRLGLQKGLNKRPSTKCAPDRWTSSPTDPVHRSDQQTHKSAAQRG